LLGSTAAEGLQRIGRTSIATRWRSCGSPQSASCSESFVIPPDVFGQTLKLFGRIELAPGDDAFLVEGVGPGSVLALGRPRLAHCGGAARALARLSAEYAMPGVVGVGLVHCSLSAEMKVMIRS
jgi:hypothetical protein